MNVDLVMITRGNQSATSKKHVVQLFRLYLFIRVPFQLYGEHTVLQLFRRI